MFKKGIFWSICSILIIILSTFCESDVTLHNCDEDLLSECYMEDQIISKSCNTTLQGICKDGTKSCVCKDSGGAIYQLCCSECLPINSPGNEICDGLDNDCNPGTPDGYYEAWFNQPCDGADTDLCNEGTHVCQNGIKICTDTTSNNLDICDGIDNDCNSQTPDGSGQDCGKVMCNSLYPNTQGECSKSCNSESCTTCTPICTCAPGYQDCNGDMTDGCEATSCFAGQCTSECSTIGEKKCVNDGYEICDDYNSDGCYEWDDYQSCGTTTCAYKNTLGSCENNCINDGVCTTCTPSCNCKTGYYDCDQNMIGNGCESSDACNGQPTCQNECGNPGKLICTEDYLGVVSCGNFDSDPCYEHSEIEICNDLDPCTKDYCFDGACYFDLYNTPECKNNVPTENQPPVIEDIKLENQYGIIDIVHGEDLFFQIKATDINNNKLTYKLESETDNTSINIDSKGYIWWTPTVKDIGKHKIKVTVSDTEFTTEKYFLLNVKNPEVIEPAKIKKEVIEINQTPGDDEELKQYKFEWSFEFWAMMGFFAIVFAGLLEWRHSKIKRKEALKFIKLVDQVYEKHRFQPQICLMQLDFLKNQIEKKFEDGKMDETNLDFLLKKIDRYENEQKKFL